ncbi:MAG: hypothetical protein AMXMBFR13_30600 [Phycisphaerae bacterium]
MVGKVLSMLQALADLFGIALVIVGIVPLAVLALVVEVTGKLPALALLWARREAGFTDGRRLERELAALRSRIRPAADPTNVTPRERRQFAGFLESYARARNVFRGN